jgi:tRNA-Thr(GGU) m(6)t(6)A37 methyltransferase TsaA
MKTIKYRQIGTIHSQFHKPEGTPIQPRAGKGISGTVEVFPEYAGGLKDLDGFSHIMLVYHFHRSKEFSLEVVPFLDKQPHGVFSTRAPARPNPIGISIVRLTGIEGNKLLVEDVDMVNGTPLLDIKPYIPEFDSVEISQSGWLEKKKDSLSSKKDDGRFSQ